MNLYVCKWIFDTSNVDIEKIKKIDDEKLEIEDDESGVRPKERDRENKRR